MKNINKVDNRGFVIVETIIVAVFVIGICTFLFLNLLPLIGDYERISKYDSVDSKYKIHEIRKMIIRDVLNGDVSEDVIKNKLAGKSYYRFENNDDFCKEIESKKYCSLLLSDRFLDVKQIMFTPFKLVATKNDVKADVEVSRELKEYIDYIESFKKESSAYDNYYRIIVVFNDGNIANLEVNTNV